MNESIKYSNKADSTFVLGPFNRAVLWVHGCCFNCRGCLANRYKSGEYKTATAGELAGWFISTGREHLTVSGGEPFLQADALARMISLIRRQIDAGVIIYTGFTLEELTERAKQDRGAGELLSLADILIDGRYEEELDDGRAYIGSSNQRLIMLTGRYSDAADSYYSADKARQIEIKLDSEKTTLIGVPSREQKKIWDDLKRQSENNGGG